MKLPMIAPSKYIALVLCAAVLALGVRGTLVVGDVERRWAEGRPAQATVLSHRGDGRWSRESFVVRYRLNRVEGAGDHLGEGFDHWISGLYVDDYPIGSQHRVRYVRRDGRVHPVFAPPTTQQKLFCWLFLVMGMWWPVRALVLAWWRARARGVAFDAELRDWLAEGWYSLEE